MNFNEYQEAARRTSRFDLESSPRENVLMAALGLSGEVGELNDYLKKGIFHGHELSQAKLTEEIGDILWYVAEMCSAHEIDLDYVATLNVMKLRRRYSDGFSSQASKNRVE